MARPPHIEHKLKSDSEYCAAGMYFLKATDGREARPSNLLFVEVLNLVTDCTVVSSDLKQLASDVLARP